MIFINKFILIIIFLSVFLPTYAKERIQTFLEGTWEIENEGLISYEHWDILSDSLMNGIMYQIQKKAIIVIEYLTLHNTKNQTTLIAFVKNQNKGREIEFRLVESTNSWIFQNLQHDFPKQIEYNPINNQAVRVTISDARTNEITYIMRKISNIIPKDSTINNPNYDEDLAKQLGADDYGMKKYILVLLKTGENKTDDKKLKNKAFKGHLENIEKLADERKIILAGPLQKNDNNYRGIFILNVTTKEDAEIILQSDPAIIEKFLDYELYNWYGSAAITEYLDEANKIWKNKP